MSAYAQITGRLGMEPELRFTHSGAAVVNLSVANHRNVKIGEERESITDWFKITVFGKDAETIAEYAKKGSALAFNGRLQYEQYTDREGLSRTATVLVASSFEFVSTGQRREAQTDGPEAGTEEEPKPAKTKRKQNAQASAEAMNEDDIPF